MQITLTEKQIEVFKLALALETSTQIAATPTIDTYVPARISEFVQKVEEATADRRIKGLEKALAIMVACGTPESAARMALGLPLKNDNAIVAVNPDGKQVAVNA